MSYHKSLQIFSLKVFIALEKKKEKKRIQGDFKNMLIHLKEYHYDKHYDFAENQA